MCYDLHVHTSASDGTISPEEIVLRASVAGLAGLAITDHDTIDGLEPARQFIEQNQMEIDFIPGIELNTDFGEDEVHILGYFIDFNNQNLRRRLLEIREQRYARAEQMTARLRGMGIKIDLEQVKSMARGELIGRPHIARVLCSNGYAASEEEAFRHYIARGRPAYVPRYKFSPAEAIVLIKQSGGVTVLAHPGLVKDYEKILAIIDKGIEGLEIYYPEHSQVQIQKFLRLAMEKNLLVTGGSDYHGPGSSESRSRLGAACIDRDMVNKLREYYIEQKSKK